MKCDPAILMGVSVQYVMSLAKDYTHGVTHATRYEQTIQPDQ